MNRYSLFVVMALSGAITVNLHAERTVTTLKEGWEFTKGRPDATTSWEKVRVPHDWAIYGPFDRANDLQTVAVEQNGETEKLRKQAEPEVSLSSDRERIVQFLKYLIQLTAILPSYLTEP